MIGAVFRLMPLLFFVVLAYIAARYSAPATYGKEFLDANGVIDMERVLSTTIATIPMVSGKWNLEFGAIFVIFGMLALFLEILRATQTDAVSITNHALSLILLVFCLILFIVVQGFATSIFFYLTMMAVIDVIAGFTVSIIAARRDFGGTGLAV